LERLYISSTKVRGDWLVWAEELNNRVHDGILETGRLQILAHKVNTEEPSSRRHGSRVLIVSIIGKLLHSNIRWVDCRLVDSSALEMTSAGHRYRNVLKRDKGFFLEPQHIAREDRCVKAVDRDALAFQTVGEEILRIGNVRSVLHELRDCSLHDHIVDIMTDQETESGTYPLFTHATPFILFEVCSRYLEEALLYPELEEYAHWFRPR
jgi:hypothetical protein